MSVFLNPTKPFYKKQACQSKTKVWFTSLIKVWKWVDLFLMTQSYLKFSNTYHKFQLDKRSQQVARLKCVLRQLWPAKKTQSFTITMKDSIRILSNYCNILTVFLKSTLWFTSVKFTFQTKIWQKDSSWSKILCFPW
jgi:hypothetical protein